MIVGREWCNDRVNGTGVLMRENGDVYEGEFKDGLRSGFGTLICGRDKSKFVGNWSNDRRHGRGRIEFANGSAIEGVWKIGVLSGSVDYTFENNSPWLNADV